MGNLEGSVGQGSKCISLVTVMMVEYLVTVGLDRPARPIHEVRKRKARSSKVSVVRPASCYWLKSLCSSLSAGEFRKASY